MLPTGNLTFPIRHAGQYYDQEVNLFYNYFRDYDPITGRYVESDPIGLDGGLNTYAYVGGNSLHLTDSLGLLPDSARIACAQNPIFCISSPPKFRVPPVPAVIPDNPPKKEENCEPNCSTHYPNLKKCDALRSIGYIYNSHSQAKASKGWGGFQSHGQGTPVSSGPCVGYGTHTNIRKGNIRIGSIVSCKCCDDTSSGPKIKEIFKAV